MSKSGVVASQSEIPMAAPTTVRALYSICETREQLGGISHTAFYEMVKRGEIRVKKIGRRTFVPASEIQRIAQV